MDILSKDQLKIMNCSIHPNNRVQFIQIKDIQEHKNLFYCQQCQNDDDDYKVSNYILIDNIQQHNYNQILDKWPPISSNSLNKKMKQYTEQNNSKSILCSEIESFFEKLKSETIEKIEEIKKKMINNAQQFPDDQNSILEKYQNISKIKDLKQIFIDKNMDSQEKQQEYRKLINDVISQQKINSETFESVIKKYEQNQTLIDFQNPQNIKASIIQLIDQINIFTLDNQTIHKLNDIPKKNESQQKCELLFDLISTKSNYCSQIFLTSIKSLLNQINPLIQTISFEEVFIKDQKPIDFSKFNNQQLDEIRDLCEYFRKMQNEQEEQMKKNDKIEQIMAILNQKSNNLNPKFLTQFQKYLIQTYSFLNKLQFDQIFLFNSKIQIDILPEIQMIKTNFQQSQQLQIAKNQNNQISISQYINDWTNCVSDLILDKNRSYVFRFQFINNSQQQKHLYIGLLRDSQKDQICGCFDYLSCYFYINSNGLFHFSDRGIDKIEKGDFGGLVNQKEIEMRVCIKDGILQILDYPNYNHILSISDEYKNNLKQYQDLRLYIGTREKDLKIQITHASKNK